MSSDTPALPASAPRPVIALGLEYPLRFRGGVSVLVEELIAGLLHQYTIVLVSPDDDPPLPDVAHVWWDPSAPRRRQSRALVAELKEHGVELVHFHTGGNYGWGNRFPEQSPIVYASRAGIRVIVTSHSVVTFLDGFCGPQKPLWFKLCVLPIAWLGKMQALWHSRLEVAVSSNNQRKLQAWYPPFRGKLRQVYHSRLREACEPGDDVHRKSTILAVGHIAFRKGQHVLAEAFAQVAERHPRWRLCLVGATAEEACRDAILKTAARANLGDRLELVGSRDDTWLRMQRAGVFVQPSLEEALGLALQEALFAGCACIGTRAGGIPELIEDGVNGLLVPANNPADMATALDRMLSDGTLRRRLADEARRSISQKQMMRDDMIRAHSRLYAELLGNAAPTARCG